MKTKTKFQPKRLLKLADLLIADARKKKGVSFNQGNWGEISDPEAVLSCGTQACAFGLAAISGAFKRAGLDFKLTDKKYSYGANPREYQEIEFLWKGYERSPGLVAMELFGITSDETDELFGGNVGVDCSTTRGAEAERAVAKRIKKLVKAVQKLKKDQPRSLALDVLTR